MKRFFNILCFVSLSILALGQSTQGDSYSYVSGDVNIIKVDTPAKPKVDTIITYYKGGKRGDVEIVPNDDAAIIALLQELWASGDVRKVAEGALAAEFIWGENLNEIPVLTDLITADLELIQREGMRAAVKSVIC